MRKTLFGIGAFAILFWTLFSKKDSFNAEPYDSLVNYNENDLVSKFSIEQLEFAYVQAVSLDNKTAQKKLRKAIQRKRFVDQWQAGA